jgi:hypothetical protein
MTDAASAAAANGLAAGATGASEGIAGLSGIEGGIGTQAGTAADAAATAVPDASTLSGYGGDAAQAGGDALQVGADPQEAFRASELASNNAAYTDPVYAQNTPQEAFRQGEISAENAGAGASKSGLPSWMTPKNLRLATTVLGQVGSLMDSKKPVAPPKFYGTRPMLGDTPANKAAQAQANAQQAQPNGVASIPTTNWQTPPKAATTSTLLNAQGRQFSSGGAVGGFHDMLSRAEAGLDMVHSQPTGYAGGGEVALQSGSFIMPADVVSHMGNGNTAAGGKALNDWLIAKGSRTGAHFIGGATDGMADEIPASVDGAQPAAVSDGEMSISPEDVKRVGGTRALRELMSSVRQARTGRTVQAPQIEPDKFLQGIGSVKGYAEGATVQMQAQSGPTQTTLQDGPSQQWATNGSTTSGSTTMAEWAKPYVTDMLNTGQALSKTPYQQYGGPLTAGASDLQTQGFGQAANLSMPAGFGQAADTMNNVGTAAGNATYNPQGATFDTAAAQKYMNPYLSQALAPQLAEAQRQSAVAGLQDTARLTQAGAFGGSRQAIMDSERERNLGTNMANITGQGYNTAYNNAQNQFNVDTGRNVQDNQFGAKFGLDALNTQLSSANALTNNATGQNNAGLANLDATMRAGAVQRGISADDIAARKQQFEDTQAAPFKRNAYMQSLLQGLPLSTTTNEGGSYGESGGIGAWGTSQGPTVTPTNTESLVKAGGALANSWENWGAA